MPNKLAPLTIGQNRIVWADPARLSDKFTISMQRTNVRVKGGTANRVSGKYSSAAVQSFPLPKGCEDACAIIGTEDQSINTVIAGSAENLDSLKKLWDAHKLNIDAAFANGNSGLGFINPSLELTAPNRVIAG